MQVLSPKLHGLVDYLTVVLFAVSPALFNLDGAAAFLSYTLAAAHFLLTVGTNFSLGTLDVVPLKLHGFFELTIAVLLVILGLAVFGNEANERNFYLIIGIVIFLVWLASNYGLPLEKPSLNKNDEDKKV